MDLFNIGNDYFWSVIDMEDELEKYDSYDFDFRINKKTQPRDLYMKVIAKNMDRSCFSIGKIGVCCHSGLAERNAEYHVNSIFYNG